MCVCEEEEEAKVQLEYSRVSVTSKRWGLRHGRVSIRRRRGPQGAWNTPLVLVLLVFYFIFLFFAATEIFQSKYFRTVSICLVA